MVGFSYEPFILFFLTGVKVMTNSRSAENRKFDKISFCDNLQFNFFHWDFNLVGFIASGFIDLKKIEKMIRSENIIPTCLSPITRRRYLKTVIRGEMSHFIHFKLFLRMIFLK